MNIIQQKIRKKKVIHSPPFLDVFEPVFFPTPFETKLRTKKSISGAGHRGAFRRPFQRMGAGASAETLANASVQEVAAGERAEGWLPRNGIIPSRRTGT